MNYLKKQFCILGLLSWMSQVQLGHCQQQVPLYDKAKISVAGDWLLGNPKAKAGLFKTREGYLVFSNGLVSRTFTTSPNTATIGLDELRGNTAFLRSVRPEAGITIDGFTFDVGGLEGQKVHNYLLKEWIPGLKANPMAFKMQDYKIDDTKPRFAWKKRPGWMPKDMPWPAPGKELTFTYKLDQQAIDALAAKSKRDVNRILLLEDRFQNLSPDWKLTVSKSHERNSFINEGKAGEIMALENAAVYAERTIPAETQVLVAKVNKGTDQANDWGLGLGVTLTTGSTRLYLRAGEGKVVFFDGRQNNGTLNVGKANQVWFRYEMQEHRLLAQASLDGQQWSTVGTLPVKPGEKIQRARVGKMDPNGGGKDGPPSAKEGRSKVEGFWAYGDLPAQFAGDLSGKLAYMKNVTVQVHYELYDDLPVFSKWITVQNQSGRDIVVNAFKSEQLAVFEPESAVDERHHWLLPNITLETDYNFGGMSEDNLYASSLEWKKDPLYTTQVNYERETPCLLEVAPKKGPEQSIASGSAFASYRVWELLNDSWERERKSLGYRKMMRAMAPWATENPVLMHVRSSDNASVKKAIDQAAEVGFEMVIMTFWSGFNAEDDSPENIRRMKELADYAHSKGIELGGYSLLASRHIDAKNDVVLPEGMRPRFGNSPCIESEWGQAYFKKLYKLYDQSGLGVFEHDGSYPGDWCYATDHPGHHGEKDSQWNQFRRVTDFYKWCREKGIYLNIPDMYFLNGGNKVGMGYREANWSLPRAQQEIIERQNIFDGTWTKAPSMGWMFVPLVEYQGGGKEATIEPLKDHLPHYEQRLANLFGAGVQACYRGPQLYDAPETKSMVAKWVNFYKKHREVLDGDIIHIRRPDGMDYDAILHVNPSGTEKGLLMVYNPLDEAITRKIRVNLYYTGLKGKVQVVEQDRTRKTLFLNAASEAVFEVRIPAKSQTWFVIK
ncbi:alpha-amylase family protein [Niabella drilacis]|uniref:Alpha-galactosidase n=1 Tax=Niabella drilacis (strain DSM 25811 / CCM 8410 / CCUG 62505 / LMG 26954 / E90) TaxID=1285928 RepID=A0A1G7A6N1_NIADE|nr:hypothetical protein [Niabella drilacis]SDE10524.1 hypothetical protein SAMN04487894_12135 [Niabella drilacis]